MDRMMQYIFALILTNAGGEAKTLITMLLEALWSLAGETVRVLDADPGNYSATYQLHQMGRARDGKALNWAVTEQKARQIFEDHRGGHVVMDTGANTAASLREIVGLLPALQKEFAGAGYRTIVIMPVGTNKPGAVGALTALASTIEGFEQIFVRVDRNRSRNFEKGLDEQRTIELSHIQPGLLSYVQSEGGGFKRAVASPPPGYDRAADHVASWMRRFADQDLVREFTGPGPVAAIDRLGRRPPHVLRHSLPSLASVTDEAIDRYAHRSKLLNLLDERGWTASAFRHVADVIDAGSK